MKRFEAIKETVNSAYKVAIDTNEGENSSERISSRKRLVTIVASVWAFLMTSVVLLALNDETKFSTILSTAAWFTFIGFIITILYNYITFKAKADIEPRDLIRNLYIIPIVAGLWAFVIWLLNPSFIVFWGIFAPAVVAVILIWISIKTKHLTTQDTKTKTYSWRNAKVRFIYNTLTLVVLTIIAILLGFAGFIVFAFAMFWMMYAYDRETREDFFFYRFDSKHGKGLIKGALVGIGICAGLIFLIISKESSLDQNIGGLFSFRQILAPLGITSSIGGLFAGSLIFGIFPNLFVSLATYAWMMGVRKYILESYRYGTAKVMRPEDLDDPKDGYRIASKEPGVYIGGGDYKYSKSGHIITVAGTRSGKGTNLIIPQLLGASDYSGSIVVLDPKGENTAVTAMHQIARVGRDVKILDPFRQLQKLRNLNPKPTNPDTKDHFAHLDILQDFVVGFNPMGILSESGDDLPDDVQMLAQMIVPDSLGANKDSHFDDKARSMIAGILTYLVIIEDKPNLNMLWDILRAESKIPKKQGEEWGEWEKFIAGMAKQTAKFDGIISKTGHEISSLEMTGNREAASVKSTARKWTDFLKSPLLRPTLRSEANDFDPNILSLGNTTLYIVIPADKLESHGAWLRLVVGACMKAVIRSPKEQVQFILDEFYALGHMSMVETAMGAYSGYGVRVWAIIQSLTQLRKLYGEEGWENFIGNASVLHAFGINDNFTADYISKMTGETSFPTYSQLWGFPTGATPRNVFTSSEVRSLDKEMLLFADRKSVARLPYQEYFEANLWPQEAWQKRYKPNPFVPESIPKS